MVWGTCWAILTLSASAWEGSHVGPDSLWRQESQRKDMGLFYYSLTPTPSPQCEKRLSFLGFQGFLSGKSFPLFYLCHRPRQKHSVLQFWNSDTLVTVHGELNESAWQGLAYILIIERKQDCFRFIKNWKVLLLHMNRKSSPPVTLDLVLT